MKIGDRVVVCETKHHLFGLQGSLIGFRGARPPDDTWLLIFIDMRNRSFLIPRSMVKLTNDENGAKREKN